MTLSETELRNVLGSNQPLRDGTTREVLRHLLKRIEDLEEAVYQAATNERRADKEHLRALLEEHIAHHSRANNGDRRVIREEKPLVDILREIIDVLPERPHSDPTAG